VLRDEGEMNERRINVVLAGLLISAFLGCVAGWSPEDKIPRIIKEELRLLLGGPGVVIVDVRAFTSMNSFNLSAYAEDHGLCPWMNA